MVFIIKIAVVGFKYSVKLHAQDLEHRFGLVSKKVPVAYLYAKPSVAECTEVGNGISGSEKVRHK